MKYSVPGGNHECLLYPPWQEVPRLIETNHLQLEGYDFEVAGASFRRLRASLRGKVASRAGQRLSDKLRIVVGAHQPGFHGPGILHKHRLLHNLSRDNLAVNFVVDSDACNDVSVKVPYLRGSTVRLRQVVVFPNPQHLVFEKLPVPPKQIADARYREVRELLQSLTDRVILRAFDDFMAAHHLVYIEGRSAARILTDYRRSYYPTPNVHDSFISAISQTDEFLIYACDIIRKIEKFHMAYNSSLNEHRQLHRIRSPANPFPNLERGGELWELPLWALDTTGRRHKLFAGGRASGQFLVTDDRSARVSPIEPAAVASLHLRPRAVCLTMFLRLFVGDLFVHGVGGGNYDQVTDRIIQAYCGVSPPGYVVCSRTKFLSARHSGSLKKKQSVLKEKLRRMRHNPEKFAPEANSLAREVKTVLSRSTGKLSAEEHARLSYLRRTLLERIVPQTALIERKLAELDQLLRRHAALYRRDLPYFLYPRSEL